MKRTIWATLVALVAFAALVGFAGAAGPRPTPHSTLATPPLRIVERLVARSSALAGERSTLLQDRRLRHAIRVHRSWTWYWQTKIHARRTPTNYAERQAHSIGYLRWAAKKWVRAHFKAKRVALQVLERRREARLLSGIPAWFWAQALCVHDGWRHSSRPPFVRTYNVPDSIAGGSGEGSWTNAGAYGGGLQFLVGTWNGAAAHSGGRVPYVSSLAGIAAQKPATQVYAAYVIVVLEHAGWGQWPNTARACGLL